MRYAEALAAAMEMLAADPRTLFLGQAVAYPGTAMSGTLANVPMTKKIEMPVAEEMQLGVSIGLALRGFAPVTIFPRWNFLILAANQLVNHLDKLPEIADVRPRVIVRVGVGSERPLYPGSQHVGDFTAPFARLCRSVRFERLARAGDIVPAYRAALARDGATVLVEIADLYDGM